MRPYSISQVRGPLRAAMETRGPDFVYRSNAGQGCSNLPMPEAAWTPPMPEYLKETGCLIGVMLKNLGIPIAWNAIDASIGALPFRPYFEDPAIEYLSTAQSAQDNGRSWGYAVAEAERVWGPARKDS